MLTSTVYFCLGKCRVVPKPVCRVHGWQGSGQLQPQVRLCESYLGLFSKGTHKMIPPAPFPRTRNTGSFRAVQHHSLTPSG